MSSTHFPVVRTISALRGQAAAWRKAGEPVALVPTMGALHEGHLSLVRLGRQQARRVVVTIFVNPAQFAPHEDLDTYPRQEDRDLALLREVGADLAFLPAADEMYGPDFATSVSVAGPAQAGLEDAFRPHFFGGVATVVAKLLLQCLPDIALFGEKDYQQLAVIRQMVRDLNIPVAIAGGETIREEDGLALSSRNAYLSAEERAVAPRLHQALAEAAAAIRTGARPARAMARARQAVTEAGFKVDYMEARNALTLAPLAGGDEPIRLLAAAWLGRTRLIDNLGV